MKQIILTGGEYDTLIIGLGWAQSHHDSFGKLADKIERIVTEVPDDPEENHGTGIKYAVIYGNYFPREVDSYWKTKEEALAQRDKLNDEDRKFGGMWEIEEIG